MIQPNFRYQDFIVSGYPQQVMAHLVIAIDGPAASGKGTLAKRLAQRLRYAYLDTGALYRCVAKNVLAAGADPNDEKAAIKAAKDVQSSLTLDDLSDPALKTDEVGNITSKISAIADVRDILLKFQQEFAQNPPDSDDEQPYGGSILDGRDIGTVVCPDADVKIYISADAETRAQRRYKELQSKGIDATYEAVLADMRTRDKRDAERETAPMKPAEDAFVIDTTNMTEAEVLDRALSIIRGHIVEALARQ